MPINKIVNNIISAESTEKICRKINSAASCIGSKFEKSPAKDFFTNYLEPVGANNKFPVLAGLMICLGIAPRFTAAAKRNPDNPEATKDELKEIAFRDVQTCAILLLLLKTLNAVIASVATKKGGLPMLNKPFLKLFSSSSGAIGAKFQEIINNPKEKIKIIGKNILDALNPMDGVWAKSNKEHISDYSNVTFEQLPRFFDKIEADGGDKKKVFDIIIDGIIEKYQAILEGNKKHSLPGLNDEIKASMDKSGEPSVKLAKMKENIEATIEKLKELKKQPPEAIYGIEDKSIQEAVNNYFKDENNSLLKKAKGLNAWLKSGALAFEVSYLGFGIPALNQLRLEKKYLKQNKKGIMDRNAQSSDESLIVKNIKAHEVKLYHNFIK